MSSGHPSEGTLSMRSYNATRHPYDLCVEESRRQEIHRRQAEILAEIGRTARFREAGVVGGTRLTRWLRRRSRHRQLFEVRLPEHLAHEVSEQLALIRPPAAR